MKKYLFLVSCAIFLQATAHAAEPKLTAAEERIKAATDQCMLRVSNGQADDAFSFLFKEFWKEHSTVGQATMAMQRQFRNIVGRAEDALGAAVPGGFEFIGAKRLGSSYVRLVYLQKNELAFLPWVFSFYRPNQDWKLSHIAFPDLTSDDIRDLTVIIIAPAAER